MVVLDGGDGKGAANATQQKLGAMMRLLEAASAQYGIQPEALLQGLSSRLAGANTVAPTHPTNGDNTGGN
jgi:flotillin